MEGGVGGSYSKEVNYFLIVLQYFYNHDLERLRMVSGRLRLLC